MSGSFLSPVDLLPAEERKAAFMRNALFDEAERLRESGFADIHELLRTINRLPDESAARLYDILRTA